MVGLRLDSGTSGYQENAAGVGTSREDATEGGGRCRCISKFLSRSDTGGVVVWGGYLGVVDDNVVEAIWRSCGFTDTGDKVEGKKAKGRLMAEGGGSNSASGSRDTTAPDLLGQEAFGADTWVAPTAVP